MGNTRVVYGNQKQVDEYKATMESPTPIATKEQAQFYNITTTRVTGYNRTPITIDVTAPDKSAETNGYKTGKAIGPAKMLQVSAGDRVQLEVFARYATGTGTNNTLITNLASAVTTTFQVVSGEAAFTALTNNVPVQAATITKLSTVPKAYLFYILFNSSYVFQQFGYAQINSAASTAHQQLYLDVTIPTGGYLYTYVADESKVNNASSVYFDDFNITHTRNNNTLQVVQTTDYYPFGLAMAAQSYQKQSTLDNDYLYNGKELQDENNLGWMDYGARMYMGDIGRWGVVDPLTDQMRRYSPYNYAYDNPIRFVDPDGMSPQDIFEVYKDGKINQVSQEGEDVVVLMDENGKRTDQTKAIGNDVELENVNGTDGSKTSILKINDSAKAKEAFKMIADNTNIEFGLINYNNENGESKSALVTDGEPSKVNASGVAKALFDVNGSSVTEIIHNHPESTTPSGYDPSWAEVLTPLRDDAKSATEYSTNSKGDPIMRAVYRPAFKTINRYDSKQYYSGQAY